MLPGLGPSVGPAIVTAMARSAKAVAYARRSASSGLTRSTSEGPVEVFDVMAVVPSAPSSPSNTNTSRPVATVSVCGMRPAEGGVHVDQVPGTHGAGRNRRIHGKRAESGRDQRRDRTRLRRAEAGPGHRFALGHVGSDGLAHREGHCSERSRRSERRRDLHDPEHRLVQDRSTLDGTGGDNDRLHRADHRPEGFKPYRVPADEPVRRHGGHDREEREGLARSATTGAGTCTTPTQRVGEAP